MCQRRSLPPPNSLSDSCEASVEPARGTPPSREELRWPLKELRLASSDGSALSREGLFLETRMVSPPKETVTSSRVSSKLMHAPRGIARSVCAAAGVQTEPPLQAQEPPRPTRRWPPRATPVSGRGIPPGECHSCPHKDLPRKGKGRSRPEAPKRDQRRSVHRPGQVHPLRAKILERFIRSCRQVIKNIYILNYQYVCLMGICFHIYIYVIGRMCVCRGYLLMISYIALSRHLFRPAIRRF